MKPIKETLKITDPTSGLSFIVKIDYSKKVISFVEQYGGSGRYQQKNFVFSQCDTRKAFGWLAILDAMKYATEVAIERLEAYLQSEEDKVESEVIHLRRDV